MSRPISKPFGFSLEIPVRNEWKNVDLMRTSVQSCFSAVFSELEGCQALSLATGELLENAMKYGNWGEEEQLFSLSIRGDREQALVTVMNPIVEGSTRVEDLFQTIAWIRGFDDAGAAYRARLLEIASRGEGEKGPTQLGLVRIAYEANATVDARVEGGNVKVIATIKF